MRESRDFIAIADQVGETTAPDVRNFLDHRASQAIYRHPKFGSLFPPPISATGIPERIRDVMWWRRSVIREGEPYEAFHRRALAVALREKETNG